MNFMFDLGMNQKYCDSAAENDARTAAETAALPRPPADRGFSRACDILSCSHGLGWTGPLAFVTISACSRCGESRYCSQVCQRAAWGGSATTQAAGVAAHKLWCGKLHAAPRPLRLIHRLVGVQTLERLGLVRLATPGRAEHRLFDASNTALGVTVNINFAASAFSSKRSIQPTEAAALRLLMDKLKPTRIVLVMPHAWAHAGSGSGESRPPDATLFEVGLGADEGAARASGAESLCDALIKGVETALPWMFAEEDRLAAGVRYAPSTGFPRVGSPCPPRTASVSGATLGPGDIVVNAGFMGSMGGGVAFMGPARWRWATMGPFQVSEMPLEDLALQRLQFFHPRGWPEGWFVVTAELIA